MDRSTCTRLVSSSMTKRQSRDEYILEEYKKAREKNSINNTDDIIQNLIERVTLLEKKLKNWK
jgi:hypothetical protein